MGAVRSRPARAQTLDRRAILRLREEECDALRDLRPDAFGRLRARSRVGRRERVDRPVSRPRAARRFGRPRTGCRAPRARVRARATSESSIASSTLRTDFSPMRGRSTSCSGAQIVEVGDFVTEAGIDEQRRHRVADAFDIHRAARAPVSQALAQLRGTRYVRAVREDVVRRMVDGRSAHGARRREHVRARVLRDAVRARAPRRTGMTSPARRTTTVSPIADVLAHDIGFVVQRRHLYRHAADRHGFEYRVRIEFARAAHVDADVEQFRPRFGCAKLEGRRPTRILPRVSELRLQREIVDLDDDAVDLVWQRVALRFPVPAEMRGRRRSWHSASLRH